MNKPASIFLSQLTILDHAYIDDRGIVVGGSFNPDFIVSGDVDPVEQVVVDFSTVKKDLKGFIDDKEDGFDHKLWFIYGVSKGITTEYVDESGPRIIISTPSTTLDIPRNAVKMFMAKDYSEETIGEVLSQELTTKMRHLYPTVRVNCLNTTIAHTPTIPNGTGESLPVALFTYSHGLKDSTSWGCNNIAHGHLSYVTIAPVSEKSIRLQEKIALALDGVVFVNKDNVVYHDEETIALEYTTSRGRFYARYDYAANHIKVLDTETTIEHLVDFVKEQYSDELVEVGAKMLFVSEGLSKGAMVAI